MANFPPPYSVRLSKRAKRIRLRIRHSLGLEVVLPMSMANTDPLEIINRFRPWIERHYPLICKSSSLAKENELILPKAFQLYGGKSIVLVKPFLKKELPLNSNCVLKEEESLYAEIPTFIPRVKEAERIIFTFPQQIELTLHSESEKEQALFCLRAWVKKKAYEYLVPLMKEASSLYNLPYSNVSFRFQKTRWGSCSIKKRISLNACLVFLPEQLAKYIVLHELAHTREMNHSAKFWKVLFSLDANALMHDKAMRHAWKYVPKWVMAPH